MASGDLLERFRPAENEFLNLNSLLLERDADYGLYLKGADDTDGGVVWYGDMPNNYAGGGVQVDIYYLMASATTGNVVLRAAFQNLGDGRDLSGALSWDENSITQAVPASAETVGLASIAFTDGADMDFVGVRDPFRLRIRRVGSDAADDASGDVRILAVHVRET